MVVVAARLIVVLAVAGALACVNGQDPAGGFIDEPWDDRDDDPNPPPWACRPVEQTGCAAGEKCTWQDVTDRLGRIACVPDGLVAAGGLCSLLAPGETAGYDDCAAGLYCLGGVCEPICRDDPDSCPAATAACTRYPGIFEGGEVAMGVCNDLCEPGPQTRLHDDAAACGGTPERPRGCYGWAWGSMPLDYTCMPDISDARHGQTPSPLTEQGGPYLSSCDAGYFPWVASFADDAPDVCIAFCVPGETHAGAPANADGVPPYTCGNRDAVGEGMECRYLHLFDATEPLDQYNASGVCIDTSAYVADWDGDGPDPERPMPRCIDLTTAPIDTTGDGIPDTPEHQLWGCAPWPASAAPSVVGGHRGLLEETLRARLQRHGEPVAGR